ncbi:MAG: hypothetical protein D6722_09680 [Bacteroidetes bacterium]|nr:MAG: hypothetical protein D6722_09680 [Bacteroidota bacterium]
MKLADCAFLTDENIDSELVTWLREQGFDVLDVKESGLFGMPDHDILQQAWAQQRIVISQDSDFGTLVFRDAVQFFGIIYLRPGHHSPAVHLETLQSLMVQPFDLKAPFIITAEHRGESIRFRVRLI